MSEAKFTKGDWSICIDCWAENHVSIDTEGHGAIAVVVSEMCDGSRREELKANAHLIAAAPEMYVELEKIAISMECMHGVDTDSIFELLAKARGE